MPCTDLGTEKPQNPRSQPGSQHQPMFAYVRIVQICPGYIGHNGCDRGFGIDRGHHMYTDGRMRIKAAFTTFLDAILAKHRARALSAPGAKKTKLPQEYITRRRHLTFLWNVLDAHNITHIGQMLQAHVDEAFEDCITNTTPRADDVPSPNTIRSVISSFNIFVKHYCDIGAIKPTLRKHLLANLPKVKTFKRHMLIIKGEHWPEIFKLAHKRHIVDRVLLELCYYTAMRASEALTVRWQDLKDDGERVHFFRPKREDFLNLKVHDNLKATLAEYWQWMADQGLDPQPWWPIVLGRDSKGSGRGRYVDTEWALKPGLPMSYGAARLCIREALLTFGISPEEMLLQALHVARRSRACHLYRNGVDIRIIAKILGHDNHLTTLEYIRDGLDEEEINAATNLPDKMGNEVELHAMPMHNEHVTGSMPAVHQTKESQAQAAVVLLNSGLLSEDEAKTLMLRIMNLV